ADRAEELSRRSHTALDMVFSYAGAPYRARFAFGRGLGCSRFASFQARLSRRRTPMRRALKRMMGGPLPVLRRRWPVPFDRLLSVSHASHDITVSSSGR